MRIGFVASHISRVAHLPSVQRMGVETREVVNVDGFTEGQRRYLEFHRTSVLLRAARWWLG